MGCKYCENSEVYWDNGYGSDEIPSGYEFCIEKETRGDGHIVWYLRSIYRGSDIETVIFTPIEFCPKCGIDLANMV